MRDFRPKRRSGRGTTVELQPFALLIEPERVRGGHLSPMSMQSKPRLAFLGRLARRKPNIGAEVAEEYGHDLVGDCLLGTRLLSL